MTLIYGHRGAKGEAPENTLNSFRQCLSHGIMRCELDLHLSADNQLMVMLWSLCAVFCWARASSVRA